MENTELIKEPFVLKDRIEYSKGSIVSQQITANPSGNLTLFAFDEGQQLSEHTSPFDAIVQILDGRAEIHVGQEVYQVKENEMLIIPANIPHALYAPSSFKMLLTMIKG